MKKMKINLPTIIISAIINIAMIALINGVDAKTIEKEIIEVPVEKIVEKVVEVPVEKIVEVEKVVEVPVEVPAPATATTSEKSNVHGGNITAKYEKRINGDIAVEFSDYSWAIINHETNEYIFQPACMGDWDMTFDNFQHLKWAMETYFQDAKVTVEEPKEEKIIQSAENKILNPKKIAVIEKELNKVPTAIKQLLIENGVEIHIQNGLGESHQEDAYTHGVYYWDTNKIIMDASESSIEYALIHEIGHALDDILNIDTEKIWESYEDKEITYDNEHFYSEIVEYVAQGVAEYYNGTMKKDTTMYKELDKILGGIR